MFESSRKKPKQTSRFFTNQFAKELHALCGESAINPTRLKKIVKKFIEKNAPGLFEKWNDKLTFDQKLYKKNLNILLAWILPTIFNKLDEIHANYKEETRAKQTKSPAVSKGKTTPEKTLQYARQNKAAIKISNIIWILFNKYLKKDLSKIDPARFLINAHIKTKGRKSADDVDIEYILRIYSYLNHGMQENPENKKLLAEKIAPLLKKACENSTESKLLVETKFLIFLIEAFCQALSILKKRIDEELGSCIKKISKEYSADEKASFFYACDLIIPISDLTIRRALSKLDKIDQISQENPLTSNQNYCIIFPVIIDMLLIFQSLAKMILQQNSTNIPILDRHRSMLWPKNEKTAEKENWLSLIQQYNTMVADRRAIIKLKKQRDKKEIKKNECKNSIAKILKKWNFNLQDLKKEIVELLVKIENIIQDISLKELSPKKNRENFLEVLVNFGVNFAQKYIECFLSEDNQSLTKEIYAAQKKVTTDDFIRLSRKVFDQFAIPLLQLQQIVKSQVDQNSSMIKKLEEELEFIDPKNFRSKYYRKLSENETKANATQYNELRKQLEVLKKTELLHLIKLVLKHIPGDQIQMMNSHSDGIYSITLRLLFPHNQINKIAELFDKFNEEQPTQKLKEDDTKNLQNLNHALMFFSTNERNPDYLLIILQSIYGLYSQEEKIEHEAKKSKAEKTTNEKSDTTTFGNMQLIGKRGGQNEDRKKALVLYNPRQTDDTWQNQKNRQQLHDFFQKLRELSNLPSEQLFQLLQSFILKKYLPEKNQSTKQLVPYHEFKKGFLPKVLVFFFESVKRGHLTEKSLREQKLFTFFYIKIDQQNYQLYLRDINEQKGQIQEEEKQRNEENNILKCKLEKEEDQLAKDVKNLKSKVKICENETNDLKEVSLQLQNKKEAYEQELTQLTMSSKQSEKKIETAENTIDSEFKGKKAKLVNNNHFEIFDELTKKQKFIKLCPWLVAGFSLLPLACIVGIMLLFFLLMPMPNLSLICFISAISLSVIYTLFLALVMFCFWILENVYDKKAQTDFERLYNELNQNNEQLEKIKGDISTKREECKKFTSDLDAKKNQIDEKAKKLEKIKITLQTKEGELADKQENHKAVLNQIQNGQISRAGGLQLFSFFAYSNNPIIAKQFQNCLSIEKDNSIKAT